MPHFPAWHWHLPHPPGVSSRPCKPLYTNASWCYPGILGILSWVGLSEGGLTTVALN